MENNNNNYFSTGALILGIASLVALCFGGQLTLILAILAICSGLVGGGAKISELRSMNFKQAIEYKKGILRSADSNARSGAYLGIVAIALSVLITIFGFITSIIALFTLGFLGALGL